MLLIAVISITTATYAWFTLTNSTIVHNMTVEVSTGTVLRARTEFSTNLADYKDKIENIDIDTQLKKIYEPDLTLATLRLLPVSSGDGAKLYTHALNSEAGAAATLPEKGCFMQFTLWFMSDKDTNVYLNGSDSPGDVDDGTKVYSADTNNTAQRRVEEAVRFSFEAFHTSGGAISGSEAAYNVQEKDALIYEPNKTGDVTLTGCALTDYRALGNSGSIQPTFDKLGNNAGTAAETGKPATGSPFLFSLKAEVPTRVVIRMWIEGEDPECVNNTAATNIEKAKVISRLRFSGAGDDGNYME